MLPCRCGTRAQLCTSTEMGIIHAVAVVASMAAASAFRNLASVLRWCYLLCFDFFLTCFVTINLTLSWKKNSLQNNQVAFSFHARIFFHYVQHREIYSIINCPLSFVKLRKNYRGSVAEDSSFIYIKKGPEMWEENTFCLQPNYQDRRIQSWLNTCWVKSLVQKPPLFLCICAAVVLFSSFCHLSVSKWESIL